MAGNVRIVLNHRGIAELLKSQEVLQDLRNRAQLIADQAGEDMEVETVIGATRARASVRTGSPKAMLAEQTHFALTRAIDAGRQG